jgi:hypothetical protein
MKPIIMKPIIFLLTCLLALSACKPSGKLSKTNATKLPAPSFKTAYQSDRNKQLVTARGTGNCKANFSLKTTQSDQKNTGDWLKNNGITYPAFVYHDGANFAPLKKMKTDDYSAYLGFTANKQNLHLAHVIEQQDVVLMIYGSQPNEMRVVTDTWLLVVRDRQTKNIKYTFDFSNFRNAPEYVHRDKDFVSQDLLWAQLEDGILYVSQAHWTYAESSYQMNGYITAIDAAKGEILWRSQPLVGNAINFVINGDQIYTAYAFTLEQAAVFALNKATGEICGQLELQPKSSDKKFIDFIALKGNQLFVHCYDKAFIIDCK